MSNGTQNLELPQMTSNTADKDDFFNEVLALVDSTLTNALSINAAADVVMQPGSIVNYVKLVAAGVPANGSKVYLPAMGHLFIIGNDKASLGPVQFVVGNNAVQIAPAGRAFVHMDGTANGIEIIGSAFKLSQLTDVDLSTPPQDGQALIWSASESKFIPGTVASSGGSSGGGNGGGTPSGYTSWRIRFESLSGGRTAGIGQFVFKDANGAVIPTTGGAALFSSVFSADYPASAAFDGTPPSNAHVGWYAASGGGIGEYIGYQFPAAINPYSITLTPANDGTGVQDAPGSFAFEYLGSDNVWHALKDGLVPPSAWALGASQLFVVNTTGDQTSTKVVPTARYWRFANYSGASNAAVTIAEMSLLDANNNVLPVSVATGSPSTNSTTPAQAVDNNNATAYDNLVIVGNYLSLDMGAKVKPVSISFTNRNDNYNQYNFLFGSLYCSNDGISWQFVQAISNANPQTASGVTKTTVAAV